MGEKYKCMQEQATLAVKLIKLKDPKRKLALQKRRELAAQRRAQPPINVQAMIHEEDSEMNQNGSIAKVGELFQKMMVSKQ